MPQHNSNPLHQQVAVITGASSGIGAALAQTLSQAGAKVALTARRQTLLEQVAQTCPGPTLVIAADVTTAQGRGEIITTTMERWGRLDILINNAGIGSYGSFLESTEQTWRQLFEINLFAPVFLTRQVLPIMQAQGRGLVINMASIAGLVAHADKVTPYVASKHALVGFTRGLARELEGTGVRVLAACPHLTDTGFFSSSLGAQAMASLVEKLRESMDSPQAVAQGIVAGLGGEDLILFPTDKPKRAYYKLREL